MMVAVAWSEGKWIRLDRIYVKFLTYNIVLACFAVYIWETPEPADVLDSLTSVPYRRGGAA